MQTSRTATSHGRQLEGKVALVTGASSGIGEATAEALAFAGASVSLVARREDRLRDLAARIQKDAGSTALVIPNDASKLETANEAVKQTMETFGQIDILVNNAGVMYLGPVATANPEDWKNMFDINVLGLMYFTHAVLPGMKARETGHIINISSVAGRQTRDRSAVYSATKHAVGAFSEGLRQEVYKEGIRVTVIEPGAVTTELTDHIKDEAVKGFVKDWVGKMRALTSEDIAASILYAVTQPPHVNVNEILLRPTDQM